MKKEEIIAKAMLAFGITLTVINTFVSMSRQKRSRRSIKIDPNKGENLIIIEGVKYEIISEKEV